LKRQVVLFLAVSVIFLSGYAEGDVTTKPEYKVKPTEIKPAQSVIAISTKINLAAVQSEVESTLPNSPIEIPRTTKDHCKRIYVSMLGVKITKFLDCEYWGGLQKQGAFSLSGNGDSLTASVPVHIWASGKIVGLQESTDANVTAFLSAKPTLASNWELKLNHDASFRWDSRPEIKIFDTFPIDIQGVLTGPMNDLLQKQINVIASQIEGTQFHDRVAAIWAGSFKPINLSKESNIWLRLGMQEAKFSGLTITDNILTANVEASASTEIFIGAEPSPLPANALPDLKLGDTTGAGFHIALPVSISYTTLKDQINLGLKKVLETPYLNALVTINNIEVYPSGDVLAIQIDLINKLFDTGGTVFLSGTPTVNEVTKEFILENISFTSESNNEFINIINMVLRSKLGNLITESYKKKYDDLLAEMNTNINHDFGHGIMSQGTLTSGKLLAISLNKEMAVIQTEVTGKVEIINSF